MEDKKQKKDKFIAMKVTSEYYRKIVDFTLKNYPGLTPTAVILMAINAFVGIDGEREKKQ